MALGLGIITSILSLKYKLIYEVRVSGEKLGYVNSKNNFENQINQEILNPEEGNIDYVSLNDEPEYELKLMSKDQETNENEIIAKLKENTSIIYKYFAVTLDNKVKSCVETIEEAQKVVEDIKSQYEEEDSLELNLQIIEEYTQNLEEITTDTIEVAENNIEQEVNLIIAENNAISINGVKIASMPIDSTTNSYISSRFGEVSSTRSSAHKGLDIACATGTPIKAVASGTVIFAEYDTTGLGYAIKIDHGNGVQTWYGHCSKLYVEVGQTVSAGDVIGAVGSTGNSTGSHLHLEIRINGVAINPQLYIYN